MYTFYFYFSLLLLQFNMQKLETIRKYFDIKLISIFNIVLIM